MATGLSLVDRERKRRIAEEGSQRVYGCAVCGRGTIPGLRADFPISTRASINTGLKSVPCTLGLAPEEAKLRQVPVIEDPVAREAHKKECSGRMFVHKDHRVCEIVRRHARRT